MITTTFGPGGILSPVMMVTPELQDGTGWTSIISKAEGDNTGGASCPSGVFDFFQ